MTDRPTPMEHESRLLLGKPRLMGDNHRLTPGVNVDRIDVAAGLLELAECGYDNPYTVMVIEHALMRWARGEEEAAQRGAIDHTFHGIDLGSWYRVLAASRNGGEQAAKREKEKK